MKIFTNAEETLMVRLLTEDLAEVSRRERRAYSWGAPIRVRHVPSWFVQFTREFIPAQNTGTERDS